MARQRMVTRTVEVIKYSVMTVNTETAEVSVIDYTLGALDKNSDAMKILKKAYETDTLKLCAITEHTSETLLYGMPEEDFIANAKILPARGTVNSNE